MKGIKGYSINQGQVVTLRNNYTNLEDLVNDIRKYILPPGTDDDKENIRNSLLKQGSYSNLYLVNKEAINKLNEEIENLHQQIAMRTRLKAYILSDLAGEK